MLLGLAGREHRLVLPISSALTCPRLLGKELA